jgi:putative redox protein
MTQTLAAQSMRVRYDGGERYEVSVRDHTVVVDQPVEVGGADSAPTPTELFVASLATCVAFYAGRYLSRHGWSRAGLGVTAQFRMAKDRPARVAAIELMVTIPSAVPQERWPGLKAVLAHCTVHNTLDDPPPVTIDLTN